MLPIRSLLAIASLYALYIGLGSDETCDSCTLATSTHLGTFHGIKTALWGAGLYIITIATTFLKKQNTSIILIAIALGTHAYLLYQLHFNLQATCLDCTIIGALVATAWTIVLFRNPTNSLQVIITIITTTALFILGPKDLAPAQTKSYLETKTTSPKPERKHDIFRKDLEEPLHLFIFTDLTCSGCKRFKATLPIIKQSCPELKIHVDVIVSETSPVNQRACELVHLANTIGKQDQAIETLYNTSEQWIGDGDPKKALNKIMSLEGADAHEAKLDMELNQQTYDDLEFTNTPALIIKGPRGLFPFIPEQMDMGDFFGVLQDEHNNIFGGGDE